MKHTSLITFFMLFYKLVSAAHTHTVEDIFPNLVLTRAEYDKWKAIIDSEESSPGKTIYTDNISFLAEKVVSDNTKPSPVSSLSASEASTKVEGDMKRMYALSLHYAFTLDEVYLNKAKEFYLAWAAVNNAISENSPGETAYKQGIEAYSIIRGCIDEVSRETIDGWIRRRAAVSLNDRVRTNNWETIRLQFLLYYGLILNDEEILDKFRTGYEAFIPVNVYPNGTTEDLLGRDAFAYHAYNLLFYARIFKAQACYYGYEYADAEYAKEHRWGASIKKAVDFWKPYILYPEKYTHVEFVETEWSPDKSRSDYNQNYKPNSTIYVVDELYYLDEELYECINKYRGNTKTATMALWLSALRWE